MNVARSYLGEPQPGHTEEWGIYLCYTCALLNEVVYSELHTSSLLFPVKRLWVQAIHKYSFSTFRAPKEGRTEKILSKYQLITTARNKNLQSHQTVVWLI